jgi:hypothetical protein
MKKTAPNSQTLADRKRMSSKQLLLFKGIALLLPFLLLALLEGALRLSGYGHDLRLFVDDPQQSGFLVMNQHASEKYLRKRTMLPSVILSPFTNINPMVHCGFLSWENQQRSATHTCIMGHFTAGCNTGSRIPFPIKSLRSSIWP